MPLYQRASWALQGSGDLKDVTGDHDTVVRQLVMVSLLNTLLPSSLDSCVLSSVFVQTRTAPEGA